MLKESAHSKYYTQQWDVSRTKNEDIFSQVTKPKPRECASGRSILQKTPRSIFGHEKKIPDWETLEGIKKRDVYMSWPKLMLNQYTYSN